MAGNKLFGIDIAAEVHKEVSKGLLDATLHSIVPGTPGADLTAGNNPVTTDHACKGFVDEYSEKLVDGNRIRAGDKKILLIGNSINGGATVPKAGDGVTIEGERYDIVGVPQRDPAAATYVLQGRSGK